MKSDPALETKCRDFGDGLQHADLVIRSHHADQSRILLNHGFDTVERHQPVRVNLEFCDLPSSARERAAWIQNRGMLGRDGDHVPGRGRGIGKSKDCQVIALGGTARKDDFGRTRGA